MAFYVYVTDICRNEAEKHGWSQALDRFKDRVEQVQHLRLFDPFPPPFIVKKQFGARQGRLIASHHVIGDHVVICFLSVMSRGESSYDSGFGTDPVGFGNRYFTFPPQESMVDFVQNRSQESLYERPAPSQQEYSFLYQDRAIASDDSDGLVCETAEWVNLVSEPRIKDRLLFFLKTALNANRDNNAIQWLPVEGQPGWHIICRYFSELRTLLLAAPVPPDLPEEKLSVIKMRYEDILVGPVLAQDQIIRKSRRSYPSLILADDDLWMQIQRDSVANLALSPEETQILRSARTSEKPFPLFINGRAGSGKSTLLQYLFSDCLYTYLDSDIRDDISGPIYFTCSSKLLQQSREIVVKLLSCGAQYWEHENRGHWVRTHSDAINACFKEFHAFIHSLIPIQVRDKQFRPDRRIDFAVFKQLWQEKFSRDRDALRSYGPDLSWHVIRTYIKGLSSDAVIDPDEYLQLEAKQRTVTHEAYADVYEKVWARWYSLLGETKGYWDDQDSTRYLIEADLVKPEFPAIFCDEAQDFTRLELELIIRLSLFSERKLNPQEIAKVPFVFAGDQFQTLNPTGFRWDAIRASFFEKFVSALDPTRKSGLDDLNYQELSYNYRSSKSIVQFSNLVQALRARLFDLRNVKPQEPWDEDPYSPQVTYFLSSDNDFWQRFKQEPDITIIVPCAEGEELVYVQQDTILKTKIHIEDGVPQNVLSASRAKGLEFNRVAVYGFGAAADPNLLAPLESDDNHSSDPDQSLPLEYFMNRLYVAVSRPKRRLFIIDTDTGIQGLWRIGKDERLQLSAIQSIRDGMSIWVPKITQMMPGRTNDLGEDRASDPEENARLYEAEGKNRSDSYLLRSAATAYRNAGNNGKSIECRAFALLYERSYVEAGMLFLECGKIDQAVFGFFQGGREGRTQLIKSAESYPSINATLEYAVSQLISKSRSPADTAAILIRLQEALASESFKNTVLATCIWIDPLRQLLGHLRETALKHSPGTKPEGFGIDDWRHLSAVCEMLLAQSVPLDSNEVAFIHHFAQHHDKALRLWDAVGAREIPEYKESAANVRPYPEKLIPLADLGRHSLVIAEFEKNPALSLPPEYHRIVGAAYLKHGQLTNALMHHLHSPSSKGLLEIATEAWHAKKRDVAIKTLSLIPMLLLREENWSALRHFMKTRKLNIPGWNADSGFGKALKSSERQMEISLTRALARSEKMPALPGTDQREFSNYLKQLFIGSGFTWTDEINWIEVGAAIERSGRITDSLAYYESIAGGSFSSSDKEHSKKRWIACKERQLAFEASQGRALRVREIESEIKQARIQTGLAPDENLSKYPHLDSLDDLFAAELKNLGSVPAGESIRTNNRWSLGNLQFTLYPDAKRINIEDTSSGKRGTIWVGEARCEGETPFTNDESNSKITHFSEWGLVVDFGSLESDLQIKLHLNPSGAEHIVVLPGALV